VGYWLRIGLCLAFLAVLVGFEVADNNKLGAWLMVKPVFQVVSPFVLIYLLVVLFRKTKT
jgi:hypothetical protein